MWSCSFESHSAEETAALAQALGEILQGGEVLALHGDLGAGKTCFVQGLARGLDVPDEVYVRSPTFTLIDTYPGRFLLHHLDLYRLSEVDELEAIGWRDLLDEQAVVAVEWANRLEDYLPDTFLLVDIALGQGDSRTLTLQAPDHAYPWILAWAQS